MVQLITLVATILLSSFFGCVTLLYAQNSTNIDQVERRIEMDDNRIKQMELFASRYNHDLRNVFVTSVDQPDHIIGTVFDSRLYVTPAPPVVNESWMNYNPSQDHDNNNSNYDGITENYLDYNNSNNSDIADNNSIEELNWLKAQNGNALDDNMDGWIPGTLEQPQKDFYNKKFINFDYNQHLPTPSIGDSGNEEHSNGFTQQHDNGAIQFNDLISNIVDEHGQNFRATKQSQGDQMYECILVPKQQESFPNDQNIGKVEVGEKLSGKQVYQLYRTGSEQIAKASPKYSVQIESPGYRREPKSISSGYLYGPSNDLGSNYFATPGDDMQDPVGLNRHYYYPPIEKKTFDHFQNQPNLYRTVRPERPNQSLRSMFKNIKQSLHNFLCHNIDDCYGGQISDTDIDDQVGEDRAFQVIQNFPLRMFRNPGSDSSINRNLNLIPTTAANLNNPKSYSPLGANSLFKIIGYHNKDSEKRQQKLKPTRLDSSNYQIIPFRQHDGGLVSVRGNLLRISPSLFNKDSYVPPELRLMDFGYGNSNEDSETSALLSASHHHPLLFPYPDIYYTSRANNNQANRLDDKHRNGNDHHHQTGAVFPAAVKLWNRDSSPLLFRSAFWPAPAPTPSPISFSYSPTLPKAPSSSSSSISTAASQLISLLHSATPQPKPAPTLASIRWPKPVFVIKQYEEYD